MAEQILSKACSKCGVEKNPCEFYKDSSKKDGLHSACKACEKVIDAGRSKARYAANPDKEKARTASYRAANSDKVRSAQIAFYKANADKLKARATDWYRANQDRYKANTKAWRDANPDARRLQHQNRRAKKSGAGAKLSKGLSAKLFKLQKGKCPCCKQPLGDDCHLDHIVPLALGGSNTDDNMQLLRSTCNMQKHAKHPIDFMQSRGYLL